jgi:hypothetical protein
MLPPAPINEKRHPFIVPSPRTSEAERRTEVDALTAPWLDTVLEHARAHEAAVASLAASEPRDPAATAEAAAAAADPDVYTPGGRPLGTRGVLTLPEEAREGIDRIFVADADRTFRAPATRARFVALLSHLSDRFGDYHQGLSYVASFLLLTQGKDGAGEGADFDRVAALIEALNDSDFYLADYWAAEAVRFATDAHVFAALLKTADPELSEHLGKACLSPDTYCQKWFVGLCVHVLPFRSLFPFADAFFARGIEFLFAFALALCRTLRDRLLAAKGPGELLALLRLDKAAFAGGGPEKSAAEFESVCAEIVAAAVAAPAPADHAAIRGMRKTSYETVVWPRVRRARERMAEEDSDSEIVFSDETTDEEGDDADADELAKGVADVKV